VPTILDCREPDALVESFAGEPELYDRGGWSKLAIMINRRNLIALAVVVVVCFVIAIPLGNKHHGFLNVVSNVTWWGGIVGLLLLIVLSVVALVQARRAKTT
jgi:hypothetical protein